MESPLTILQALDLPLTLQQFRDSLRLAPRSTPAFVYVHGVANSFDDALRRTLEFSVRFRFPGAAVAFDWPSQSAAEFFGKAALGAPFGQWKNSYEQESDRAAHSVEDLRQFLAVLRRELPPDSVHLIAHSLGGRVLATAIITDSATMPRYRAVTFLSPDVDTGRFRRAAAVLVARGTRVELYAASGDRALGLSNRANGTPPAGLVVDSRPLVASGVETIDMSCAVPSASDLQSVKEARALMWSLEDLIVKHSLSTEGTILYDFFWSVARNQPARCRVVRRIADQVDTGLFRLRLYDGYYAASAVPADCVFPPRP